MDTVLDVNVKEKTAKLWLDWMYFTVEEDGDLSSVLLALEKFRKEHKDTIKLSVEGERINVHYHYDFGPLIPNRLWEFGKGLLSFEESEPYVKEIVLEAVRQLIPGVLKSMRETAIDVKNSIK